MYLLCCFFHFQLGWSNLSLMNLFWISTDNFKRTCIYCQHTVLKRPSNWHSFVSELNSNWNRNLHFLFFFLPKIEFWGLLFRQEDHYGSLILRVVSRDPRLLNMLWHQILWHNVHENSNLLKLPQKPKHWNFSSEVRIFQTAHFVYWRQSQT